MSRLEKIVYYGEYTAGSYLDAAISIPIWTAEQVSRGSEKLLKDKIPNFLSLDYTKSNSPVYKCRESLRDKLDTKPGVAFLQSSMAGLVPFFLAGMPAAEIAQKGIDSYMPNAPELMKYTVNSFITLGAQMATSYIAFMASEIKTNLQKYVGEDNKISPKKVWSGFKIAVKTFLSFDLSYIGFKAVGQSALLAAGKDPWKASGIADSVAIPVWYVVAIPLGLSKGLIETKHTKK